MLITSAASPLAHHLARGLYAAHDVRLTDIRDARGPWPFVRCDLGHDEATDRLVAGVDVLIHLALPPPEFADGTETAANELIDYRTRRTYNLLLAASEAGGLALHLRQQPEYLCELRRRLGSQRTVAAPAFHGTTDTRAPPGGIHLPRVCAGGSDLDYLSAFRESRQSRRTSRAAARPNVAGSRGRRTRLSVCVGGAGGTLGDFTTSSPRFRRRDLASARRGMG